MFTIDLLKGEGLPAKVRTRSAVIAGAACSVPVAAAIVMFGFYLHNRIIISIEEGNIAAWKLKTEKLSEAVTRHKAAQREKALYGKCLSEVKTALGQHTQWSPILATVVEIMPDSVVLRSLEVKERMVKRKIPRKDEPEKTMEISIAVPILRMSVAASSQSQSDKVIRDFRDKLRSSESLGPKLENITHAQRVEKLDGLEVVAYDIDCLFKPNL